MPRSRECLLPYEATKYACGKIARPISAASLSGFVNLILIKENRLISVGNKSSPFFNNRVYIKSMSFGGSTSSGASIVIVDTSGNDFYVFMNNLYRDSCTESAQAGCFLEFGWIATSVNDTATIYSTANVGKSVYADSTITRTPNGWMAFVLDKLEVTGPSEGCWEYTITLKASADMLTRSKLADPIGTENHKVALKDAGREMLKRVCKQREQKSRGNVYFFRNSETHFEPYGFLNSEGGALGPKASWEPGRKNPIQAMRNWMNGVTTDRKLGTVFYTDPTILNANIVALEGDDSGCNSDIINNCTGTSGKPSLVYLVNAGDCTPVVSFNPQVSFTVAENAQGGGSFGGRSVQARACVRRNPRSRNDTNGIVSHITVPQSSLSYRSPDDALLKEAYAQGANLVANTFALQTTNVTGDLVIQGDVRYSSLAQNMGSRIAIIYFNNPAVRTYTNGNSVSCDWLAYPAVNHAFSSTEYTINGVTHDIGEDGKYETKISVMTPVNADSQNKKVA
jgi:hypothetical protein